MRSYGARNIWLIVGSISLLLGCKPRNDSRLASDDASRPYTIFLSDSFSLNPANSQSFYDAYAQSFIFEPLMIQNSSSYMPMLADVQVVCSADGAMTTMTLPTKTIRSWPDYRPVQTAASSEAIASENYAIAITNVDIAFTSILLTHDGVVKSVMDDKQLNLKRDYAKLSASLRQIGANNRARLSKPISFTLKGYNQIQIVWAKPTDCETFTNAVKTMPIVPEHVFGTQLDGRPLIPELGTRMCPTCKSAHDRLMQRASRTLESQMQQQAQKGGSSSQQEPVTIKVDELMISHDGGSFNVQGFQNHMMAVGESGTFGSGPYEVISEIVDKKLFGVISMPFYAGQKDLKIANYQVGRYRNTRLRTKRVDYCNPIVAEPLCEDPEKRKVILYSGFDFIGTQKTGMEFGEDPNDDYDLHIGTMPQKRIYETIDLRSPSSRVRGFQSNEIVALAINTTRTPNIHVRQAMALAINRIAIDQARLDSFRENKILGYEYTGSTPDQTDLTKTFRFFSNFDPTRADAEVKQAGWQRNILKDPNALGGKDDSGTLNMLHFTIAFNSHDFIHARMAKQIQDDLKKFGMSIDLVPFSDDNYVRALRAHDDLVKFDAMLVHIPEDVLNSPVLLANIFDLKQAPPTNVFGFDATSTMVANLRPFIPLYYDDLFISVTDRTLKACQTDPANGGFPAFLKDRFFCRLFLNN